MLLEHIKICRHVFEEMFLLHFLSIFRALIWGKIERDQHIFGKNARDLWRGNDVVLPQVYPAEFFLETDNERILMNSQKSGGRLSLFGSRCRNHLPSLFLSNSTLYETIQNLFGLSCLSKWKCQKIRLWKRVRRAHLVKKTESLSRVFEESRPKWISFLSDPSTPRSEGMENLSESHSRNIPAASFHILSSVSSLRGSYKGKNEIKSIPTSKCIGIDAVIAPSFSGDWELS